MPSSQPHSTLATASHPCHVTHTVTQIVTEIANGSNYKDVNARIARIWGVRTALELVDEKLTLWNDAHVETSDVVAEFTLSISKNIKCLEMASHSLDWPYIHQVYITATASQSAIHTRRYMTCYTHMT